LAPRSSAERTPFRFTVPTTFISCSSKDLGAAFKPRPSPVQWAVELSQCR
jgi:hypothetical protein